MEELLDPYESILCKRKWQRFIHPIIIPVLNRIRLNNGNSSSKQHNLHPNTQNRKSDLHRTQSYADYILVKHLQRGQIERFAWDLSCVEIPNHIRFKYGFKTRKIHTTLKHIPGALCSTKRRKHDNFSSLTL